MESLIDIRRYSSEKYYEVNIAGLKRNCPVDKVASQLWIVGNEQLCFGTDIELTQKIAKRLAEKLSKFKADCIFTAEAKSLGIAFEVAKNLGHKYFAIARKSVRPYQKRFFSTTIESITSAKKEHFYLDETNISRIRGKRIILLDDVISTGKTLRGLCRLAKLAKAEICAIAAVWLEGYGVFEKFQEDFIGGRLAYLATLPLFSIGKTYERLLRRKYSLEKRLRFLAK